MRIRTEPAWINPPEQGFAALMELYEENYILLRRLCPSLREMGQGGVSSVTNSPDLHINVLERGPYATTFFITHLFSDLPKESLPDLQVRIYQDARVAEVIIGCESAQSIVIRDIRRRYRINRFLNRWLTHCLYHGHGFQRILQTA